MLKLDVFSLFSHCWQPTELIDYQFKADYKSLDRRKNNKNTFFVSDSEKSTFQEQ